MDRLEAALGLKEGGYSRPFDVALLTPRAAQLGKMTLAELHLQVKQSRREANPDIWEALEGDFVSVGSLGQ